MIEIADRRGRCDGIVGGKISLNKISNNGNINLGFDDAGSGLGPCPAVAQVLDSGSYEILVETGNNSSAANTPYLLQVRCYSSQLSELGGRGFYQEDDITEGKPSLTYSTPLEQGDILRIGVIPQNAPPPGGAWIELPSYFADRKLALKLSDKPKILDGGDGFQFVFSDGSGQYSAGNYKPTVSGPQGPASYNFNYYILMSARKEGWCIP